jgi:Kdo2-lipid IVA lauroyltransferase/acyltransferase
MLLRLLFRCLSLLPLSWVHALGDWLGRFTFLCSATMRARITENLIIAAPALGLPADKVQHIAKESLANTGRTALELSHAWLRPLPEIEALIKDVQGWQFVEAAQQGGRGIIFVTPHLGGYDIAGRYLGLRVPMTVLYREPKVKALEPLMKAGRDRGGAQTVPTGIAGVKGLLKALKGGRSVIVLPDQAPHGGDGVWAPFFGKPAFTMTLIARLAESTGAAVLYFTGERLANGKGFRLHIVAPEQPFASAKELDKQQATEHNAALVNRMTEKMIAICPEQYLWSYNRYKQPSGAPSPIGVATQDSHSH